MCNRRGARGDPERRLGTSARLIQRARQRTGKFGSRTEPFSSPRRPDACPPGRGPPADQAAEAEAGRLRLRSLRHHGSGPPPRGTIRRSMPRSSFARSGAASREPATTTTRGRRAANLRPKLLVKTRPPEKRRERVLSHVEAKWRRDVRVVRGKWLEVRRTSQLGMAEQAICPSTDEHQHVAVWLERVDQADE